VVFSIVADCLFRSGKRKKEERRRERVNLRKPLLPLLKKQQRKLLLLLACSHLALRLSSLLPPFVVFLLLQKKKATNHVRGTGASLVLRSLSFLASRELGDVLSPSEASLASLKSRSYGAKDTNEEEEKKTIASLVVVVVVVDLSSHFKLSARGPFSDPFSRLSRLPVQQKPVRTHFTFP